MALKLCLLIEYQIRNIFMENHAEYMYQKLVPDPFLILVNNFKLVNLVNNSNSF